MSRGTRALARGIRAGMPILVLGMLMTAGFALAGSPRWIVNLVFAVSIACALVAQVSVAWRRWRESDPAGAQCRTCKTPYGADEASAAFCKTCGAWKPAAG